MFTNNAVRAKKPNIHVHIRPDVAANTSLRPKDFMRCNGPFSSGVDFIRHMTTVFENVVKNTPIKQLGRPFKTNQFDIKTRYNPKIDSTDVKSTTHRCVYNVMINKDRGSSCYGYNFYIYFIPKDEIVSCIQKDTHFVAELKSLSTTLKPAVERRINSDKPVESTPTGPHGTLLPKGCKLMYKIESDGRNKASQEPPFYVGSLDAANWLKKNQNLNFKEVLVALVEGVPFEVVTQADIREIDTNDYTQNYIFKSKVDIPKHFKYKQYKVNKSETVYSNMLIDDAVEGVYDMVGKKAGMLVVIIHRSFLGDTREVLYTEDPAAMATYKDKFINRQKI